MNSRVVYQNLIRQDARRPSGEAPDGQDARRPGVVRIQKDILSILDAPGGRRPGDERGGRVLFVFAAVRHAAGSPDLSRGFDRTAWGQTPE